MAEEEKKLKEDVFAILKEHGLDSMTKKKVRLLVEQKRGSDSGALKSKKDSISKYIDLYMEENRQDSGSDSSDSSEPEPSPKKKRKKAPVKKADPDVKKTPTFSCKTRSGGKAPSQLKNRQCDAMTIEEFQRLAPRLELEIFGNKLTGEPRSFTSGNRGWYSGGKIEVPFGDKILWGQLGINLSIVGSKEWD